MGEKAIPLVKDAIKAITPGYSLLTKALLAPAEIFWFVSLVGRKIRLFSNPKNMVPLMAGSVLEVAAGNQPTLKNASRVLFGSASILNCSKDILCIAKNMRTIVRIFQGKSYVAIKKKTWEGLDKSKLRSPSDVYFTKIKRTSYPILAKRIFHCVLEILKSLALLALHFADAVTAYREKNATSEIFVHGIDIYNHLTSSDSEIVKHLKRLENVTDMMLVKMGASWATTALVGLFVLPAKIRQQAPSAGELVDNFVNNVCLVQDKATDMKAIISEEYLRLLNETNFIHKLPKELVPSARQKYASRGKMNDMRFLKKPIMRD